MSEWQPIETAPRDGTRVMLIDTFDQWHYIGRWNADLGDQGFWEDMSEYALPTHWMPLPAAPKEGE